MSTVWTRPVPPGITAAELDDALEALTVELGPDKVMVGEAELREFRDPFQHASSEEYTASAVVMPTTVQEIQGILRIANERGVPVWTHVQGRNNGCGGPAPRVKGWGSVVGNTLEHGGTYLPYGLDFGMQCGMEVVLADGTVMRTGMGAMEGNRAWHCYKRGLGPTPDQMFMQSNFGIVTKMGYWLMPEPEIYMPLWLRAPKDDDLGALVDTLRRLMLDGTIRMVPQIGNVVGAASVMSKRTDWWDGDGAIPEATLQRMADELGCGRWTMRFALYGDEAVVDHRFAKIKDAFETAIPGGAVWGTKHGPEAWPTLDAHEQVQAGIPNLGINAMTAWYGGEEGGHVGFSPVAPLTGRDALAVRDLMRPMMEEAGLDYFAGICPINARSFAHVTLILFDLKDQVQSEQAYALSRRLVEEAGRRGYGEYRAHIDFMDLASDQYGFNDHAYRRFNERIKDALDPNGILSPGKSGIWPAHMREDAGGR
jgi:4-cresol dehydrogenase (hydroxylating)